MNSTASRGLVVVVLVTCTLLLLWWFVPKPVDKGGYLVTSVLSGDTIVVERDGETHEVHLFGIWAPATGECGFEESRQYLADGIEGTEVVLKEYVSDKDGPAGEPSVAANATWERYVELERHDAGLAQIEAGHAVASGEVHDRSDEYWAAQRAAQEADLYACE